MPALRTTNPLWTPTLQNQWNTSTTPNSLMTSSTQWTIDYLVKHDIRTGGSIRRLFTTSLADKLQDWAAWATQKKPNEEQRLMTTIWNELQALRNEVKGIKDRQAPGPATQQENGGKGPKPTDLKYSTIVKSANPTPIRPQRQQQTRRTFPKRPEPTNSNQRHHNSRLILHFNPPINFDDLKPGEIVHTVNTKLAALTPPIGGHIRIQGVIASGISKTPIVIAGNGCTATDLEPYSNIILESVCRNSDMLDSCSATADRRRFELCINNVPRRFFHGETIEPNNLTNIIADALRVKGDLPLATPPRYLIPPDRITEATSATVLVSFTDEEMAKKMLNTATIFVDGRICKIRQYIERSPVTYCKNCSSTRHRENSRACQGQRCEICTSTDHTAREHPRDVPPKCINCAGTHQARARECPARRQSPDTKAPGNPTTARPNRNQAERTPPQPVEERAAPPQARKQKTDAPNTRVPTLSNISIPWA